MDAPVQLSYAPPDPLRAARRQFQYLMLSAIAVVLAGVLGASFGRALTPMTYRATGLSQARFPGGMVTPPSLAAFEDAQRAQIKSLRTPAALATIADGLTKRGHNVPTGRAGAAYIDEHLRMQPVTNSTLYEVVFESPDSQLSINAVTEAISMSAATPANGIWSTWIFSPPLVSAYRSPVGGAIGAVVGVLAISAVLVGLRARNPNRDGRAFAAVQFDPRDTYR